MRLIPPVHSKNEEKDNMDLQTQRFVRKPLFVDAVQVTNENIHEVAKWCQSDVRLERTRKGEAKFIKVRVIGAKNERVTKAYPGDWVLYAGTSYRVYPEKAFHSAFDPATE